MSAAVGAGELTEATRIATLINDTVVRTSALAKVALGQAEAGDVDAARIILDMIREPAARMDDPVERAHVFTDIAAVQAATGDVDDATQTIAATLETVQAIESTNDRADVLAVVGEAQAKAGHVTDARATLDTALDLALSVEDEFQRRARLRQLVSSRIETGQLAAAINVATLIANDSHRAAMLADVALAQTESNDMADARDTITLAAQAAKASGANALLLANIATVQAKAGMIEEARATFRDALQDVDTKSYRYPGYMLAGVAAAQAEAGNVENSRTTIDKAINNIWSLGRGSAINAIAAAQIVAGDVDGARLTLKTAVVSAMSIKKPLANLSDIAVLQIAAGDVDGARDTIDMVITRMKSTEDAEGDFFYLQKLLSISEADQLDELLAIHRLRDHDYLGDLWGLRASLNIRMASSVFSSGRIAAAVTRAANYVHDALKSYADGMDKDNVLLDLASSQAIAQQFTEALDTAKLIVAPDERINAFVAIAEAQEDAGIIEDARSTLGMANRVVRELEMSNDNGSWALSDLARAQMQLGLVSGARINLHRALRKAKSEDGWYRMSSLSRILDRIMDFDEAAR